MLENLWSGLAPKANGTGQLDTPTLSIHTNVSDPASCAGVIVCPGGGYRILASTHEGLHVAHAFNRIGVKAFVLKYRVAPTYPSTVSLLDGQRAVRYVRHHADQFGIDPERIGILGFSAGGHLALATGTAREAQELDPKDAVDNQSSMPDFLVPIYAVSNGLVRGRKESEYFATDTEVVSDTPPTFLVHTHEDAVVSAEQSTLFYDALRRAGVPAELHVFGYGEHGIGLGSGDPETSAWFGLLHGWLRRTGLLTNKTRVGIKQKLDTRDSVEADLGMAWLTLIPEDATAPVARTRVYPGSDWMMEIPQQHGPVPGRHRLEIRRVSHSWPWDASGEYSPIDWVEPIMSEGVTYQVDVDVTADGEIKVVKE